MAVVIDFHCGLRRLRAGARKILSESEDFQKLLRDLRNKSSSQKAKGEAR